MNGEQNLGKLLKKESEMKIEGLKTKRRKIRDSSQYKCVSVDYEL